MRNITLAEEVEIEVNLEELIDDNVYDVCEYVIECHHEELTCDGKLFGEYIDNNSGEVLDQIPKTKISDYIKKEWSNDFFRANFGADKILELANEITEKLVPANDSDDELIAELKKRGFKIFKEL